MLDDNGVICWSSDGRFSAPSDLVNPFTVVMAFHTACALTETGIRCWGAGAETTGKFPHYSQSNVPANVHAPIAISAGYSRICAYDEEGLNCWDSRG